ncbi:PAS domain S-box protein [Labilibacter sediminis]|nr:PAS domain S-box protein [Labilibacter sediminis]
MNRESLENTSRLHSLEAENKHLKSLLNRVVTPGNEVRSESSSSLIAHIELLFEANRWDYKSVISPVLKGFGELIGVDRASIFYFDNMDECFYAANQWVNNNIQEYHPADLSFTRSENPLNKPTIGGSFASSNILQDTTSSLAEKLAAFQVKSILMIPFKCAAFPEGIIVLESCSFNREWYDFEVKEIQNAVHYLSHSINSLWNKTNADEALRISYLGNAFNRQLKSGKKTKKAINEALHELGNKLGFNSIYLVEKDCFSNDHEISWACSHEHEERCLTNADISKLGLSSETETNYFFKPHSLLKSGIGLKVNDAYLVLSILSYNSEPKGWLVGDVGPNSILSELTLRQFWESVSMMIADVMYNTQLEVELNEYKHNLNESAEVLRQKESFLKHVLANSPFGIMMVENQMVKYANGHVANVFGYPEGDIIGKSINILFNELNQDMEEGINRFYFDVEEQGAYVSEITLTSRQGEKRRISFFGSKDSAHDKDGCLIFTIDKSESYFAKQEIQESRARYQKILESTIDGVVVFNKDGGVHYVNDTFCDLLGYTNEETKKLYCSDFVNEEQNIQFQNALAEIESGVNFKGDTLLRKKNGELLEAEVGGTLIQLEGVEHYYFSVHDISIRKQNEKVLHAREVEFRSLAENSPDIILRLDEQGKILFFNQTLVRQFSFLEEKEIVGKSLKELDVLGEFIDSSWQAKISDAFLTGQKLSMDMGFSDETRELYYEWRISPEINEDGEVESILAFGRNLTLRKTTEKQLLLAKERAEESDKLKTSFLANISHELRTPLNAIVGFSALLRGDELPMSEKEEYVDVIHKNSDALMNLINNIIDVAKIESGKISVVKEEACIDSLMNNLYDSFVPKVEIEHKGRVKLYYSKPNETGLKIYTDPIRLKQVLVNLIGNAIKFTLKGFVEFGYTIEKEELRFYVKDTGIGISEAKQSVIFQPFRKEDEGNSQVFGGTGIGLPISEKLVNALGGKIGLISEKGQGSEFFFTHPIELVKQEESSQEPQKRTYTISQPVLPKNYQWQNKLVLLVDENSSAHLQMRKIIEKTGVTLVSARTAAGASRLLMNRSDIHLVLMDLNFPDSDGYELVRIIKERNKNLPVIAHSAKAFNGERERLLQGGFDACVLKPTEKDELLMVMDQLLSTPK